MTKYLEYLGTWQDFHWEMAKANLIKLRWSDLKHEHRISRENQSPRFAT